jgi:hypothetical protein
MLELLRPPPHRGPLISAGAVSLATGLAVAELRLNEELALGVHVLLLAVPAALMLAIGLLAPAGDDRPFAYQSVLLVAGLLLLFPALIRLAEALGAEFGDNVFDGAFAWIGAATAAVAAFAAAHTRSAACLLIAALAGTLAVLSGWDWIFDPGTFTASRWLLFVIAIALVMGSLVLRALAPRHAEVLIVAAALAVLLIGLQAIAVGVFQRGDLAARLPGFWEFVLLAGGCGLVAFGALDRAPGPAWLGLANLAAFTLAAVPGEATLYWWPFVLIVLGVGAMLYGLRPRQPLPPEPEGYDVGDRPLASRVAGDEELVVRVRDDRSP